MPPLMVTGVNYSAPMHVTINEAPDPNIHPTMHPTEIQKFHLDIDNKQLSLLEERLKQLNDEAEEDNREMRLDIEDKYSKSLFLN